MAAREIKFPILGRDGLIPARFLPSADQLRDGATRFLMTRGERDKLAGVQDGATANASDAELRSRSTHTGRQPAASIDASGTADGRVLTSRGGETVWAEQPIADFSVETRHINPAAVLPPSNLGTGQMDSSAVLHGDGVFRQVSAVGTGGGGGGGVVGFSLEMHPTDPGIAVLTLGAGNQGGGQPPAAASGPSAVSVTVDATGRVTCSASMTATGATYTELNISISTPSPNPSWRASVARTANVTVNGVKALTGTTSSPLPPGNYEAYVSSSKDGGVSWQTGPRTSFTVAAPAGGTQPGTGAWPVNVVGQYMQVWPSSPGPEVIAPDANVVTVGFVNTNNTAGELQLVGYSQAGRDQLRESIRQWRAAGKKVGISAGGAGYDFDLRNPDLQAQRVKAISDDLGGIDFFDFDVERRPAESRTDSSWTVDRWVQQHVAFCDRGRRLMGTNFGFTMAPGGSTINDYYTIAAALNNNGYLTQIGHQFYEWNVDNVGVVINSINRAKGLGIPAAKIAVGMMLGATPKYWSQSRAVDWMTQIRDQTGVTKAYLWEAALPGSTQWAANVRGVLPW